jgi:hypothetical protein
VDATVPDLRFWLGKKAFLCAFFCQSGTVRIPCLRSLCTYNFLKSVHFAPRLAVRPRGVVLREGECSCTEQCGTATNSPVL